MSVTDRLTPREREVLRLRVQGLGTGQIAKSLGITPHTVRKHLDNAVSHTGTGDLVVAAVLFDRAERHNEPA